MITRTYAITCIEFLAYAGILGDEIEEELIDIVHCLEAEENWGISAWGMPDEEYTTLVTAMRTDLPEYEDFIKKQKSIISKHKLRIGE